ncbi:MAG: thioesterase family protein, partial [bacterium]
MSEGLEKLMAAEAFARSDGPGRYIIDPVSRGPWDANSLHARVLAGLFGHEVETRFGGDGFHCARLTIDLYRLPTLAPCEIAVRPIREGNRIRVIEVEYLSEGTSYARGTAVLLKRTENPTGTVWSPPAWDVKRPDEVPASAMSGVANWEPMWDMRPLTSRDPGQAVQGKVWMREIRPLVAGAALTPLVRAASAADWANPGANWGSNGLEFINADITMYLHRYPEGEWIGFETASHHSAEGIAVGECTMYDEQGAIGTSTVCALAQR